MNGSKGIEESKDLENEARELEEENGSLTRKLKSLEVALVRKKQEAQTLLKRSEDQKQTLLAFVGEEHDLVQEIEFYESEKEKLNRIHAGIKAGYESNMETLETMIKGVGFLKGEIGALLLKMGMLEEEIPGRFRDADNLDKKIKGTFIKALNDLRDRIDYVERRATVLYYQK